MFRKERPTSTRKYEEKLRNDPVKSRRPDLPIYGPGWLGDVSQILVHYFYAAARLDWVVEALCSRVVRSFVCY